MAVEPVEQPDAIRVSDSDRDRAVQRLQAGMAEGRIDTDEFTERSRLAYKAKYPSDLAKLTSDLPAVKAKSRPVPATQGSTKPKWMLCIFGAQNRTGSWGEGTPIRALSVLARQTIDLTGVKAKRVSITSFSLFGSTEILVPRDTRVDIGGIALLGSIGDNSVPNRDMNMHVEVRGWGIFGGCKVRNLTKDEVRLRLPPPR